MGYFEGLRFFLLLSVFALVALGLQLKVPKATPYWISAAGMFFLLVIYRGRARIFVLAYLVYAFALTRGYLAVRSRGGRRNGLYYLALCLSLVPLVINKISGLSAHPIGFLGISYISFKTVQMVIEIYDGLIKTLQPLTFLGLMIHFPTMSSGPIDRYRRFQKDFENPLIDWEAVLERFGIGLWRLFLGVFYKFVISMLIYKVMGRADAHAGYLYRLISMYTYGLYLFFDFAGYSLMAVGASQMLGINTPMNFNKPFLATSIKDFWNRWHITLSTWLRDYVFSRLIKIFIKHKTFKNMRTMAVAGYMVNMFLMGIWHGLTRYYVIYGIYHGVLLSLNEIYESGAFFKKYKKSKTYQWLARFVTFQLVMFGMYLFSGKLIK